MPNHVNKTLGEILRTARHNHGHSLRTLAAATGVQRTVLERLEKDWVAKPDPRRLQALAAELDLDLAGLYAAAGYDLPATAGALPTFAPYLRSKYRDLPPEARAELGDAFQRIAAKHGYHTDGPRPGEDES